VFQQLLQENAEVRTDLRAAKMELREARVEAVFYRSQLSDLRKVATAEDHSGQRTAMQAVESANAAALLNHTTADTTTLQMLKATAEDFESIFAAMPDIARMHDAAVLMQPPPTTAAMSPKTSANNLRRSSSLRGGGTPPRQSSSGSFRGTAATGADAWTPTATPPGPVGAAAPPPSAGM
jgi:hypothetical protein